MEKLKDIDKYLELSVNHMFKMYEEDFSNFNQNKIKVITGFNTKEVGYIHDIFKFKYPNKTSYVLTDKEDETQNHIVSDSFKEMIREGGEQCILVPTDKKIALDNVDAITRIKNENVQEELIETLLTKVPDELKKTINEDIIQCLEYLLKSEIDKNADINKADTIKYLIKLEEDGYTPESIGNSIHLLNLIPDADLLADTEQIRNRINVNLINVKVLSDFELTLYNRITELTLAANSVQRDLVEFFRFEKDITEEGAITNRIFEKYPALNFANWDLLYETHDQIALPTEHVTPNYDLLVGNTSHTSQFGIIGESVKGRKIAVDLSGTNTISLFGVQGAGKSYTIGTISEMVIKEFSHVNELPAPLAGVIFHYSESMDYEPEFTSMMYPNDKIREAKKLKERYGADPDSLDDVIIICPLDKVEEKRLEYPSITVEPIAFNPQELNVQDWMFMLGALGSDANYVRQLKAIAKKYRKGISLDAIEKDVHSSILFTEFERGLALQKLGFAREYVDEKYNLHTLLRPGRLIIVDLRDEFIDKDEALGLFVVILNIFSAVKKIGDVRFNKFIVFDEAHKYMDNKALTSTIVTAIREMRHKGVSIMIASQDPPSLPKEIIELSSVVLLHKFNSPQWLDHIKNAITQLEILAPQDMSVLNPGEAYIWATKATERGITYKPLKISARPRVTQHGGATLQAGGSK